MRERHLHSLVARGAQGDQILKVVRNINKQVLAPALDVMNIQGPAARASLSAAHPAALIPRDDGQPNALPSPPVLEPLASPVVGMGRAYRSFFGALVRAEPPPALSLTGERSEWFPAALAFHLFGGNKPGVSAFRRTIPDAEPARGELGPARPALDPKGGGTPLGNVTFSRAETHCRSTLHFVSRALKTLAAVAAIKRGAILHRLCRTSTAAKPNLRIVGAKLPLTLGAYLEQG